MKVPLDWLKEFIDISDISLHNLTEDMTTRGLEVDAFNDHFLEVSQTPDLGYTRSIVGVARFIRQFTDLAITMPKIEPVPYILQAPKVSIDDVAKGHVLQYSLQEVRGIQNGPSPDWMQSRLKLAGMTPKNLIIDVTNYVQIAFGQPMHAFDADHLEGSLHVSMQSGSQSLKTLLDTDVEIPPHAILIQSKNRTEAVAGVIGSKTSAISSGTSNILLESAQFSPTSIRRTSKNMRLSTPSSQRFENQIDPDMVPKALEYAVFLLHTLGKGTASQPVHHTLSKLKPHRTKLHLERVESLLGIKTSIEELKKVLEQIDTKILEEDTHALFVEIPLYRTDLAKEIDLIEEIIKILGFDRLLEKTAQIPLSETPPDLEVECKRLLRKKLLQQGLMEIMTPSLVNKEHLIGPQSSIEVKNALSDRSVLRTTHLYGALESVLHNQNHGCHALEAFEIGAVYYKEGAHFKEETMISVVIVGNDKSLPDLKGVCETLFEQLHVEKSVTIVSHLPQFHPHRQAHLEVRGKQVAQIGELHPQLLKEFGIKKRVYFAEIAIHALMHVMPKLFHIQPISSYPAIERDTTLVVPKTITFGFIEALIQQHRPALMQEYHLKGIYDPDPQGAMHNVTLHWVYRSLERSLTQEEVDLKMQQLLEKLQHEINS
jgi:phenylalanyl-tRNA synthetase beta chain